VLSKFSKISWWVLKESNLLLPPHFKQTIYSRPCGSEPNKKGGELLSRFAAWEKD
jgi:hypothetical protein